MTVPWLPPDHAVQRLAFECSTCFIQRSVAYKGITIVSRGPIILRVQKTAKKGESWDHRPWTVELRTQNGALVELPGHHRTRKEAILEAEGALTAPGPPVSTDRMGMRDVAAEAVASVRPQLRATILNYLRGEPYNV